MTDTSPPAPLLLLRTKLPIEVLKRMARGYTVDTIVRGPSGIDAIKAFEPDAVIVDALFPGSRDLIQTLRFGRDTENIVVLVLGDSDGPDQEG